MKRPKLSALSVLFVLSALLILSGCSTGNGGSKNLDRYPVQRFVDPVTEEAPIL